MNVTIGHRLGSTRQVMLQQTDADMDHRADTCVFLTSHYKVFFVKTQRRKRETNAFRRQRQVKSYMLTEAISCSMLMFIIHVIFRHRVGSKFSIFGCVILC